MENEYSYSYQTPYQASYQTYQASQPYMPQYAAPIRKKEKKQRSAAGIVALALCCSLLGGAVGAGAVSLTQSAAVPAQTQSALAASALVSSREGTELELVPVDNARELSAAEVYAKNVNSTVGITTEIQTSNYWGYPTTSAAAGSGFLITEDGYVLTNYHVVEGASAITVATYDGKSYDAKLVGYDETSDVAVLKIEATGLTPVILGDSDKLNVGDTVLAIGNPLGELTFSLSSGVVSALSRDVSMSNGVTMSLIQTDAAINSGNSGGALFNSYGEVVGITNAKYSSSGSGASIDNIGFAIPINGVLRIVSEILENGYYAHPYIGVSVSDAAAEGTAPAGALIVSVVAGSPAEKAGLRENDRILSANGVEVSNRGDLCDAVDAAKVGDTLTLEVYRDGETKLVLVTVGEKPQAEQQQQEEPVMPWGWGYLG